MYPIIFEKNCWKLFVRIFQNNPWEPFPEEVTNISKRNHLGIPRRNPERIVGTRSEVTLTRKASKNIPERIKGKKLWKNFKWNLC